ncbi:MAG TPA: hypothetical protein VF178_10165, partial [Gemmatimonadaceae bacterium]
MLHFSTSTRGRLTLLAISALAIRLVIFAARGAFIGFDEGYYLLLARNLWSGHGYTLNGLPHVVFSPLYPVLTGGLARLTGDLIWAGRLVSAIASAALVIPTFYLARRIADERSAWIASA